MISLTDLVLWFPSQIQLNGFPCGFSSMVWLADLPWSKHHQQTFPLYLVRRCAGDCRISILGLSHPGEMFW